MKHTTRLILTAITCLLCSCAELASFFTSPAGQTVVQLAELGLTVAAAKGKIKEGDSIAIQRGLAIVTSPDTATVKTFKLADIGLQAAVDRGLVKPGDAILIQQAEAIIKPAVIAMTAPKAATNVTP
ncbi:MAG: hypothetical protein ACYC67_10515 [Prosthecobacter sp.]